jgi:ABC-2 type transport system permease protein
MVNRLKSGDVLIMTVVPILTFLLFGALGSFIFQRKEIK